MCPRAVYNGILANLLTAYRNYRELSWSAYLSGSVREKYLRQDLHNAVRYASAFWSKECLPIDERNELARHLVVITDYAVNWTGLK